MFCSSCGSIKMYAGKCAYCNNGGIYAPSTVEEWQTGYKTVPTPTGILLAVNELARQVAQLAEIEAREHDVLKRENERLRAKINELMGDPK